MRMPAKTIVLIMLYNVGTYTYSQVSNERHECNERHGALYDVIVCFNKCRPKSQKLMNVPVRSLDTREYLYMLIASPTFRLDLLPWDPPVTVSPDFL